MNKTVNNDSIYEKKLCPYKDKCYRKNPIHFSEMSHPHLEKLIIHQLDKTLTIPDHLDFDCPDRSQLLDQLKVLQIVLKKDRGINKDNESSQSSNNSVTISPKQKLEDKNLVDLKEKIEKHKKAALQKREEKLKQMDVKAANLIDKTESQKPAISKRSVLSTENNKSMKKAKNDKIVKLKDSSNDSSFSSIDSQASSSQSYTSEDSYSGKSYIENFAVSNDRAKREKIRDQAIAKMRQGGHNVTLCQPGEFALKYALSAPYHYFFNRVEKSKITYDQQFTVTFPELLDISLGEIVDSLHINFMVELGWLCVQYLLAAQNPKMTIFCGSVCDPQSSLPSNINLIEVNMPTAYGCHHSKISVLKYSDGGIRIIVSTANIYTDDWENRTQGIWMSPHLPPLPDSANPSEGDSSTKFKKSFREYLAAYKHPKLVEWEHLIKRADFSSVNVFFLASVPGSHKGLSLNSWGLRRLATILSEYAVLPPDAPQWTIIAQSSSIGSLGPNYENWILSNVVASMSREKIKGLKSNPNFQFIYPSLKNYEESFDCKSGSCCLPYSRKNHKKQEWLKNYLYQWKADQIGRTKAMPHIKSYTRISPDQKQIPWFILTSANLSKGAWGSTAKTGVSNYIMNYEAGVVFIPNLIINQTTFPIKESNSPEIPIFRLPYDLPLTKYQSTDTPFVIDYIFKMNGTYVSLNKVKICRNEDVKTTEEDIFEKKLELKVSTWMKLYATLETSEFRAKMRDVSILISQKFFGNLSISEHGTFLSKFNSSAPYNYFLTTVTQSKSTHTQQYSVTFHEIIDHEAGEIVESFHLNFKVEVLWITSEYMLAAQVPNMTILYGSLLDPKYELEIPFNIELVEVETSQFKHHYSKISIFKYNDNSIRIMISSANLYAKDWETRTEGLWISPLLPPLPESASHSDGESITNFKKDFIEYLQTYREPQVFGWEALVHRTDFSVIKVFFIASVPGCHEGSQLNTWGSEKLGTILSNYSTLPSDAQNWPIVAQSSSVGDYGQDYQNWISTHIVKVMSREKEKKIIFFPDFKFVYPSLNNFKESYDSNFGITCLTYIQKTHLKQEWIKNYLCQWKSEKLNRTLAMPHIKCYTRISPDETEIAWFVLSSASLIKSAWGRKIKGGTCQCLSNYEAGVVFIPQIMINQTTFPIVQSNSALKPVFILPYDLPLTPYEPDDEPFLTVQFNDIELNKKQQNETAEPSNPEIDATFDKIFLDFKEQLKFYEKLDPSNSEENANSNSFLLDAEENENLDETNVEACSDDENKEMKIETETEPK